VTRGAAAAEERVGCLGMFLWILERNGFSFSHHFKYTSSFQKFLSIARLPNMSEPGEQKFVAIEKLNDLIVHSFLKHVQICVRTNGRLA
jgi:hypothetical protein